tara:strand:- start:3307 stop:3600 length:294 start_codon:yes stop_codon:yes gene_type:complete
MLEGMMRVIKNMIQAKKNLAEAYKMLEELVETTKSLTDSLNDSTLKRRALMKEHDALLDAFAAERAQKERYRTAFLDRMNVPVIGKAWDGDGDFEEI